MLKIYNSGSFLDENEIACDVQKEIISRAGEVFDVNFNVRSVEKVYRDLLA